MSILPVSHSNQSTNLACAQGGRPVCLEALLLQHKRLIYVVVRRQSPGESDYAERSFLHADSLFFDRF